MIKGIFENNSDGNVVRAFYGIPYTTAKRWKPPTQLKINETCWNGTFEADDPGPACYQHKGNGKVFLNKIINQYLKDANVFLEVKRTNFPAINLYLSFGFQEINIRKQYYSDGEDAIEMVKKVNTYGLV